MSKSFSGSRVALRCAPSALTEDSENTSPQKAAASKPENLILVC